VQGVQVEDIDVVVRQQDRAAGAALQGGGSHSGPLQLPSKQCVRSKVGPWMLMTASTYRCTKLIG
jgi:hypothetical protein